MRMIDADKFFENYPELAIEPYINAPTVDPENLIKPIAGIKCEITEEEKQRIIELLRKGKPKLVKLEPERPQGYWNYIQAGMAVCPFCGGSRRDNRINHINFCNCCGADMRGEKND